MDTFSAIETAGPPFFLSIAMFGFVFQLTSLVQEKELKLRQVLVFFIFLYEVGQIQFYCHLFKLSISLFPLFGLFIFIIITGYVYDGPL